MIDLVGLVGRFVLELAVIIGCFIAVMRRPEPEVRSASFGLLGVMVASIVANLAKL